MSRKLGHRVTRSAKSGETYIAYQVVGDGPPDLVYVPGGPFHVELNWKTHRSPALSLALRG